MSIYSTRKSKSQKNGPSGVPGPASASPWRAKEKKSLEKKFHNAEKLKGDHLGFFNIHAVAKHQKIEGGYPLEKNFFRKKSLAVPKKIERGIIWSRSVLYDTRETFLVQFLGPAGTIWRLKIL